MRRWRKPPDICMRSCKINTSAAKKANLKIKLSKRPISNGIRAKMKLPNLPKRNRAFLIWLCHMKGE